MLVAEQGQMANKAAIQREVAQDANVTPDAVKKASQRARIVKPTETTFERVAKIIAKALAELTAEDREKLIEIIGAERPGD